MAKSTRTTTQIRIAAVQELLLEGQTRTHILEYASQKWDLGDRQADEYISMARAGIDEVNLVTAEENLAIITRNLWDLYRRHRKDKAWGSARGVLIDIARMRGLDKMEINLNLIRKHAGASDEDLAKALAGDA